MHTIHQFRITLAFMMAFVAMPLFAQGTENAIAAAVMFGVFVFAFVLSGLVITLLYVFKRRRWQRIVVLVFGAALLVTGLWLGAQSGRPTDMEFLRLLVSGAGVLFLLLGTFLRPRNVLPGERRS
jgi:peptidoglycan/LPS O-acetylase OafA/YrhL